MTTPLPTYPCPLHGRQLSVFGIFWVKGLESRAGAPRPFPLPLGSGPPCLAHSHCCCGPTGAMAGAALEVAGPEVYFSLVWALGWVGSVLG